MNKTIWIGISIIVSVELIGILMGLIKLIN